MPAVNSGFGQMNFAATNPAPKEPDAKNQNSHINPSQFAKHLETAEAAGGLKSLPLLL